MATEALSRAAPRLTAGRAALALALLWLCAALLVVLFADQWAPFHYAAQKPLLRFSPPSFLGGKPQFLLGSDSVGRDLFSRLLYGVRLSMIVAALGTFIGAVAGTALGALAAYRRGLTENLIMGLVDVQASLPFLIFAIGAIAIFGPKFWLFIIVIGVAGWERYARLARGLILEANETGYADALRSLGAGPLRIFSRHVLRNIAGPLVVQMTLNFPETILLETGLSFLGFGIQPPLSSLGTLVSDGRANIFNAWWIVFFPALAIFLTTLAVSILGDAARDRLDATTR